MKSEVMMTVVRYVTLVRRKQRYRRMRRPLENTNIMIADERTDDVSHTERFGPKLMIGPLMRLRY